MQDLGPHPRPREEGSRGGPPNNVHHNPPGDSNVRSSLRTTVSAYML